MDTAEYLRTRQQIEERLASHRYHEMGKPSMGPLGWFGLASAPAAAWFLLKKWIKLKEESKPQRLDFLKYIPSNVWPGGLLSAAVWIWRFWAHRTNGAGRV